MEHWSFRIRESIKMSPVMNGLRAITGVFTFLHDKLYPGFFLEDVMIHNETAEQAFAEYHRNHKSYFRQKYQTAILWASGSGGRQNQTDREAIDVVVGEAADYPNGLLDVIKKS